MIDLDVFREELARILPKSQHKKIDPIVALLDDTVVYAVDVRLARLGIETVTAYGLTLTLDAYGNAATVEFPDGAEVCP